MSLKKLIRTVQVFVPMGVNIKGYAQRLLRKTLRIPSEPTYYFFEKFPFGSDRCFVDIGANRGQTIAAFRLYQQSVPVVSFEPNIGLVNNLRRLYGTDPNLEIKPVGLGDEDRDLTLHIPSYYGFVFDGLASFDQADATSLLNEKWIYWFNPSKLKLAHVDCSVRRLDDFDLRPDLIKIDVQGFEVPVLRGAVGTIEQHRPVFIIENDEIMAHATYLESLGYIKFAYDRNGLTRGEMGDRNTIYIPQEKVELLARIYAKS